MAPRRRQIPASIRERRRRSDTPLPLPFEGSQSSPCTDDYPPTKAAPTPAGRDFVQEPSSGVLRSVPLFGIPVYPGRGKVLFQPHTSTYTYRASGSSSHATQAAGVRYAWKCFDVRVSETMWVKWRKALAPRRCAYGQSSWTTSSKARRRVRGLWAGTSCLKGGTESRELEVGSEVTPGASFAGREPVTAAQLRKTHWGICLAAGCKPDEPQM
jgi:hypothetical protein